MMTQAQRDALITDEIIRRTTYVAENLIRKYRMDNKFHDDIYSAAYFSLIHAARTFDGHGSFWGFSYVLIKYAIIDEIRDRIGVARLTETTKSIRNPDELHERDYPIYYDKDFDRTADREFILSLAPNDHVKGILVRRLLGYSSREIADELGVSSSRVSQVIHRLAVDSA